MAAAGPDDVGHLEVGDLGERAEARLRVALDADEDAHGLAELDERVRERDLEVGLLLRGRRGARREMRHGVFSKRYGAPG